MSLRVMSSGNDPPVSIPCQSCPFGGGLLHAMAHRREDGQLTFEQGTTE
jgi:hypothetical protein